MGEGGGAAVSVPDPKTCVVCGRSITWRRKWARDWEQVRYCSAGCRGRRREHRPEVETAVLDLLGQRAGSASICPSEVARRLAGQGEDWRSQMEPVREAVRRLAARGEVEVLQRGQRVDPSTAKGPIRVRRLRQTS